MIPPSYPYLLKCLDHSPARSVLCILLCADCRLLAAFYAFRVLLATLVVCGYEVLYFMAPTHIDQHASYYFSAASV